MSIATVPTRGALQRILARLRLSGRLRRAYTLLRPRVEAFDRAWYLRTYPDVATARMGPLLHYLRHGRADGRAPNERIWRLQELAKDAFDPAWYVRRYPDVGGQGVDPLAHYLLHGRHEGRFPTLNHARAVAWVQSFGER